MATATKRRPRGKAVKARTLEQVALDEFASTGEVSGLGVLADWVEENHPERGEYANQLRAVLVGDVDARAVRFFCRNAGCSYMPGEQTLEQGRLMGACDLARAEAWLEELKTDDLAVVEWEEDPDADRSHLEEDDGRAFWWCLVVVTDENGKEYSDSLCGIDLGADCGPWNGPYARVVVAELASEAWARMRGVK